MLQGKLKVSQLGDRYEQEAEWVAEQVMRMPESKAQKQKAPDDEMGEANQIKGAPSHASEVTPQVNSRLSGLRGGGEPLPHSVRLFFEPRFGQDFSGVRVHRDGQATESAKAINARAYTIGQDIVFGRGEYAPESWKGKKLLAHELAHVMQNRHIPKASADYVVHRKPDTDDWWECIKGLAVGFGSGVLGFLKAIGASIWSPIETVKNIYHGIVELINAIRRLDLGETAEQLFPKIYTLVTQWLDLISYKRCKIIGEIIGEYGAGLVSGAGLAKVIKKLKRLKRVDGGASSKRGRMPRRTASRRGGKPDSDIDEMVERGIVEERISTPRPRKTKLRRPSWSVTGRARAARRAFNRLREDFARRLGVQKGGQVHHAIELHVLDRYPDAYTASELNQFGNMRGIATELRGRRQLHNSKIREMWDRHYKRLDQEIRERDLQVGTPEFKSFVRLSLAQARAEIDYVIGQFFSEYRAGVGL